MSEPAEQIVKREDNRPKLGLHYDIPEDEYHNKLPGISKHGLDMINQSGAHYIAGKTEPWEPTQPMIVGSAFHVLTLEPVEFGKRFVVNDKFKDFRTTAAKDWKKEQASAKKNILSVKEYDNVNYMVEAVRNHPFAGVLCDPDSGKAEVTAFWIDNNKSFWAEDGLEPTNRLCKLRADYLNEAHHVIVDLKKAECAGMSKFARQVHNYRYHVQDVYYTDGLRMCKWQAREFIFVVVEPEPPYGIGVYRLSKKDREFARQIYKRDLQKYHDCMTANEWPAYPPEVRELELPNYSKYVDYY